MPASKHPDISKQTQHLKAHNCSAKLCPQTYLPCVVSITQNIRGWWWQVLFWRGDTVPDGALRAFFLPIAHSCNILVGKEGTWSGGVPKLSEAAALKQISLFQALCCDSKARGIQINEVKLFCRKYKIIFFLLGWEREFSREKKQQLQCLGVTAKSS